MFIFNRTQTILFIRRSLFSFKGQTLLPPTKGNAPGPPSWPAPSFIHDCNPLWQSYGYGPIETDEWQFLPWQSTFCTNQGSKVNNKQTEWFSKRTANLDCYLTLTAIRTTRDLQSCTHTQVRVARTTVFVRPECALASLTFWSMQ
jgi:hypothetical protein